MSQQIINTVISKIAEYDRMLKGVGKTKKLPHDWLNRLKAETVTENVSSDIYRENVDQYFSKIKEDINRISSLENL